MEGRASSGRDPDRVEPGSPAEVAEVLRDASRDGLVVQVEGGGGHSGYGDPVPPDLVLSTAGLAGIEEWEPDDLTVVARAGTSVAELEAELGRRNQTAVLPEHPGASTLGGVVAAGVSALRRGRLYGTRERILEITAVTGDGRVVRSGGRVVKNVTGYDLHRLHFGAFGSLGVIVGLCLKLWPVPRAAATVEVGTADEASVVSRPLAVLESDGRVSVMLWGTEAEVSAVAGRLGGRTRPGLHWPRDPGGAHRWSLRVPPALTGDAIQRLPPGWGHLAIHGVGEVRLGSGDARGAADLRSWAESVGGRLVVVESPPGSEIEPWGAPPPAVELQRRLIAAFDPARVLNPGRLPAGL